MLLTLSRNQHVPAFERCAWSQPQLRAHSHALILQKSRMRKRARTDLCGGRSAMIVPTATIKVGDAPNVRIADHTPGTLLPVRSGSAIKPERSVNLPRQSGERWFTMTFIELMFLMLLMFLACLLGIQGSRYVGWWAWMPAFVLGSLLMFVAVSGLVTEVRRSVAVFRQKLRRK